MRECGDRREKGYRVRLGVCALQNVYRTQVIQSAYRREPGFLDAACAGNSEIAYPRSLSDNLGQQFANVDFMWGRRVAGCVSITPRM